jgi:lipopolysaccharide/colanic/teichoic acid biosynthesis glycosyltransferase
LVNVNSATSKSPGAKIKGRRYKRPLDLSILIAAHMTLLPLWALLWTLIPMLVWLGDRGPIFFRQERAGKDGKSFIILKFRTMIPDSSSKGPAWTTEGDLRVTAVGKILRRTALDELPGIISIWKGDMSLVGPRALDVKEHRILEQEIPGFEERLRVVPGLTGLAQIHDRQDIAQDKFRYDLEYIDHMSIWLDLKLLLLSVSYTFLARWDQRAGKVSTSPRQPAGRRQIDTIPDVIDNEPAGQDRANTLRT